MLRKVAGRPYKTMVHRLSRTSSAVAEGSSSSKKAVLQLVRFDPEKNCSRVESYEYDKSHDYMVLDLLIAVKAHQDPTLAFRSSCCEGVCGSCAMNINGINSLACITFAQKITTVGPLPNFPVIKDFVVDLRYFFQQYSFIRPFVRNINLSRSRIDAIDADYQSIVRAMNGMSANEAAATAEGFTSKEPAIGALQRLCEAFCDSGNVSGVLDVLGEVERRGGMLDHEKTIELIKSTLANHRAARGK
ncbi:unnamed protein product [Phytomonas sp. Hart1]|nr:unnamed protein product [Phytomonas sp. Hart1]|eukprot:CCW67510.1 unnamed protein product [Phytomonas sp. isolate Hart1]